MKNIPFLMKFPSDYTLLSLTRTKGTRSCISYFETLEICGCFFGGGGLRYWKVLNWDSETGSGIVLKSIQNISAFVRRKGTDFNKISKGSMIPNRLKTTKSLCKLENESETCFSKTIWSNFSLLICYVFFNCLYDSIAGLGEV